MSFESSDRAVETDHVLVTDGGEDETEVFTRDEETETEVFDRGQDGSDRASDATKVRSSLEDEETTIRYDEGVTDESDLPPLERWFGKRGVKVGVLVNVVLGLLLLVGASIYLGWGSFLLLVMVVGLLLAGALYGLQSIA